ncbi:MAG: Transcriptional regulatory protein sin3 [Trizodia sp. TS-e1964]|nr:MAG: Transcriptional regulatory protein sin3 [Trizodia sp. TS-e1964]
MNPSNKDAWMHSGPPGNGPGNSHQLQEPQLLQNHTGGIPIHQPQASKLPTAIHGPNGILATMGAGAGSTPGTSNMFGGMILPPISYPAPHPRAHLPQDAPQGQQPILNDALSYLDQVKFQFSEQPDVYNKFLDIMKDFKSASIDTPGVIDRVSTLFAGHPNLIQGFNTFLPPGYRIECGTGDDQNVIRVTTPQGTTVQSMPKAGPTSSIHMPSTSNGVGPSARAMNYYDQPRTGSWQQSTNDVMQDPGFSPHTNTGPPGGQPSGRMLNQAQPPYSQLPREQSGMLGTTVAQTQQEHRGVSQLQNAVSAATSNSMAAKPAVPSLHNSLMHDSAASPAAQHSGNLNALNAERRGPVEFNHAINYVNKIKNRFQAHPDIYKQFLEILQTYQRESKPIQDVYAQVTDLFKGAPDLLEDFKQFLPESAAQAKAQAAAKQAAEDAAMLSSVRDDPYQMAGSTTFQHPNRSEVKMPPVGNFPPPPTTGKEGKKRRAGALTGHPNPVMGPGENALGRSGSAATLTNGAKRPRLSNKPVTPIEIIPISPTLTPGVPEPLLPQTSDETKEALAFFEKTKKFINNKSIMNEFLKLLNLYNQDCFDAQVLREKVHGFIGRNQELMTWFERFLGLDERDAAIKNKPKIMLDRPALSKCRSYASSYRLLPIRERQKKCSGRDYLCNEVLNDEWASHPTWASEDSGFLPHKKNQYEENLHIGEEERYDFDFAIEIATRAIELLLPIVRDISEMTPEQRETYQVPPDQRGTNPTLFLRVLKKIYDNDMALKVLDEMWAHPCAVIPVVCWRIKSQHEKWKAARDAWLPIWRAANEQLYWKSLDHIGINAKAMSKKENLSKTIIAAIQTRYEEQRRSRFTRLNTVPNYQFEFYFQDTDVIFDAARLLLASITHSGQISSSDRPKLETFIKQFLSNFFGLPIQRFNDMLDHTSGIIDEDADSLPAGAHQLLSNGAIPTGSSNTFSSINRSDMTGFRDIPTTSNLRASPALLASSRFSAADLPETPRISNIRRAPDDLESTNNRDRSSKRRKRNPTRNGVATQKDDIKGDDREPMADTNPPSDEEMSGVPQADNASSSGQLTDTWIEFPFPTGSRSHDNEIPNAEPFKRDFYSLYCNPNIYCFFKQFELLYSRLLRIKQAESNVLEAIKSQRLQQAAQDLKLMTKMPEDFFRDTSSKANYYQQILEMFHEYLLSRVEMAQIEEILRRYYLIHGSSLYCFDKLLIAINRYAHQIVSSDVKDKSNEIIQLFFKDRASEETTHSRELQYRKQVQKMVKENELYRVTFFQSTKRATAQYLLKDDNTFDMDQMDERKKWEYYIASFATVEPTEGVILERLRMPFLKRNHPKDDSFQDDDPLLLSIVEASENLVLRICVNSYKALYQPNTSDSFFRVPEASSAVNASKEKRSSKFIEKFSSNSPWFKKFDNQSDIDAKIDNYKKWIQGGTLELIDEDDTLMEDDI